MGKLHDLIKNIRFAMLTTQGTEGMLHSCPMTVQEVVDGSDLWFFIRRSSAGALDIGRNPRVNVSLAEPQDQKYVSVSGSAQLTENPPKAKELWSPLYKTWFPKGLEDPELALLHVSIDRADYWDVPKGTMIQLQELI